ncbi:hypothetical protein [Pseudomonas fluorescens]|uniref:hypothetical protein n=1 Tax=Pseudomonas fluorescens TaxID=294 RepID=UPI003D1AC7E4
MNAYVSTELSMIQMLDPQRHELALLQEAFLNKGGTIEVLQGPSFVPPPIRHEPPPRKKVKAAQKAVEPTWLDKMAQRDIEREERVEQAAKDKLGLIELVRKLAETMDYSQAIMRTGLSRTALYRIAKDNGFKFQPSGYGSSAIQKRGVADEENDAKNAERIKAFKELGLTRNQAMGKIGVTFRTFNRILAKYEIAYPKCNHGPQPAFFPKHNEVSR